jgi:peptide/nickel transport system permease protein
MLAIPTLFIVALFSFILMRLTPGDVILAQIGASNPQGVGNIDPVRLEEIKRSLGLYGTVPEQFARWLFGVLRGDFGESWLTGHSTLADFTDRMLPTLELGILSTIYSVLLGVVVGTLSALYRNGWVDQIGRTLSILALSTPNFFLGVLVIIGMSRAFGITPPTGIASPWSDPVGNFGQFLAPSLVLAAASAGTTARLTRTSLLEVLRQDYIRTAHSKGLNTRTVIVRHALRNALLPVVTVVGAQLTILIAGAVVVEQIFNIRGVGQLTISALFNRDYMQLQTNVFLFAVAIVAGNLLVDLSYGWIDPRVKYS